MIKTKNNPKKYKKREVTAPKGRTLLLPNVDSSSAFFTAPMRAGYLDWRFMQKPTKQR